MPNQDQNAIISAIEATGLVDPQTREELEGPEGGYIWAINDDNSSIAISLSANLVLFADPGTGGDEGMSASIAGMGAPEVKDTLKRLIKVAKADAKDYERFFD